MTKVVFEIEGMSCNHCRMSVEKALKAVRGVASAEVSLTKKNAVVMFDEAVCALPELKAAVEDAGYSVVG